MLGVAGGVNEGGVWGADGVIGDTLASKIELADVVGDMDGVRNVGVVGGENALGRISRRLCVVSWARFVLSLGASNARRRER